MCRGLRHPRSIAAVAASLLACVLAGTASADTAGTVHFVRAADSSFDSFTSNATPEGQAWLRAHMWRMIVWSPFFDNKTSWYPGGWMYDDAYAIYTGSQLAAQHPEWILRDASGNKLYIPFNCSGGTCPQYAGDISNPAFRRYWIEQARAQFAHGYRGLFVDDVNLEERVGNAAEAQVTPVGAAGAIAPAAWRAYMAEFMAEVRAALPGAEIVHNALWFANGDAGPSDPSIRRQIESANLVLLERGVNDSGLTGGIGPWSLNALFAYVDEVHSLGRAVVLDGSVSDPQGMQYNLASYFLISGGADAVSSQGQTPANWWHGFDVNLGEATDARHPWAGVLRRDFTGGVALVNPPGSPAQTVALPGNMHDLSGNAVSSVTLPAASGAVLTGTPSSTPAATAVAAASTRTTLEARVVRARQPRHHGAGGGTRRAWRGRRAGGRAHAAQRHGHRAAGRPGLLTRIAGFVRRATDGSVVISIDRRLHRRWIGVRRVVLSVTASGRFMTTLRLNAARYRVCATYTGAAGYRPSSSGYHLLAVRAG
jgi:Hypothetical glycosyl hydrolase family 15